MADTSVSDEQIRDLLKNAEQRLRSKGKGQAPLKSLLQTSMPKVGSGKPTQSYLTTTAKGAQVNPDFLIKPQDRVLANGVRSVVDPVTVKVQGEKAKKANAGSDWFNLPKTNLTPELKRDLQLLRMRDTLDPKRFYKKDNTKTQVPEYSQVGTIIQGPTEYFSARLTNKERKQTLVEEILAGETATGRFKSKYNQIQATKTSGKKAHYKKMLATRRSGNSNR